MALKPTRTPATVAGKPTRAPAKKKQPASVETSQSIEEQTRAFFKAGGKIEHISSGVSGQPSMAASKHISLGNGRSKSR